MKEPLEPTHYKDYVGQYVKRFYTPFEEKNIFKIKDCRQIHWYSEFLYETLDGEKEWWTDCEDSTIITNELPMKDIDWVCNIHNEHYKGFNPFEK